MKTIMWLEKATKIIKGVEKILGEGTIEITSSGRIWITWHNIDLGEGHCFDGLSFVICDYDGLAEDSDKMTKQLKKSLKWKSRIIDRREEDSNR